MAWKVPSWAPLVHASASLLHALSSLRRAARPSSPLSAIRLAKLVCQTCLACALERQSHDLLWDYRDSHARASASSSSQHNGKASIHVQVRVEGEVTVWRHHRLASGMRSYLRLLVRSLG
mmetsp:Transcript_20013/g.60817  ORF Transcript_20013/g.60817 Transcript_20013/m.60817 type:complete len:120 (+) Transcript_20013:1832-2191(+)